MNGASMKDWTGTILYDAPAMCSMIMARTTARKRLPITTALALSVDFLPLWCVASSPSLCMLHPVQFFWFYFFPGIVSIALHALRATLTELFGSRFTTYGYDSLLTVYLF